MTAPIDATPHQLPAWRRALSSTFTLLIFAVVIFLWPAPLGGSTRLVIVSGHSMEPTYDFGDIVVTRGSGAAGVGETVVFEVPEGGGEGLLVIHRVVDVDDAGFFVTQGDNRDTPDRWQLTQGDIIGEPMLRIPHGGHVVFFLQQWVVIAILLGLLTIFLLWPNKDDIVDMAATAARRERIGPDHDHDQEIDPAVMDEAKAWLDDQLAIILPIPADEPPAVRALRRQLASEIAARSAATPSSSSSSVTLSIGASRTTLP